VTDAFKHWFLPKRGFDQFIEGVTDNAAMALSCSKQMVEAVLFLWSSGIEHKDFQRSNLLWGKNGLKVIDYDTMGFTKGLRKSTSADAKESVKELFIDEDWSPIEMGDDMRLVHAIFAKGMKGHLADLDSFAAFYKKAFETEAVLAAEITPEAYASAVPS
jgi:hypothetical protein